MILKDYGKDYIKKQKRKRGIKKMFNRQFNIKKDFSSLNELENEIYPKIRNATFKSVEDKKQIIDYIHKIFNNQYRKRGINE